MRILVVNNYGQFNHLIRRAIREKVETDLISNQTPPEKIDANGLILGGGPNLDRAGRCPDYLRDLDIPILGIVPGHAAPPEWLATTHTETGAGSRSPSPSRESSKPGGEVVPPTLAK